MADERFRLFLLLPRLLKILFGQKICILIEEELDSLFDLNNLSFSSYSSLVTFAQLYLFHFCVPVLCRKICTIKTLTSLLREEVIGLILQFWCRFGEQKKWLHLIRRCQLEFSFIFTLCICSMKTGWTR